VDGTGNGIISMVPIVGWTTSVNKADTLRPTCVELGKDLRTNPIPQVSFAV
jgi:hypothetical protein